MTYKYIINGIGMDSFGDILNIPLLICSNKQIAKTIQNSFKRAIKEIVEDDVDAKDIGFYQYEDEKTIFKQVRNELKFDLFTIIASSDENKTALPELETKVNNMIDKLFDEIHSCLLYTNPIVITKLPYI